MSDSMLTTKEGEASSSNNNGSYCENGHGHRGKNQDVAIAAPEVKKGKTFLDLPFEIRERILIFAHEMTLKERPGCIATVTNKPRRFSPGLLARSGEWGPVFQIIYANKQLHEEAIRIRYREIYIKAGYSSNAGPWVPMPDDSIMLDRLQSKAIQDYTKYAVIEIFHPQPTSATNQLIEVLGKMKSLKHLCLAVREATSSPYNLWDDNCHSRDFDILKFFGLNLNLETLTIQRVFCTNVNYPYEIDFHSYEKVAQAQNIFFYFAYKRSRWYKDPENKNKVAPGQVSKVVRYTTRCMDKYTFQLPDTNNPTFCPKWHLRSMNLRPVNPHDYKGKAPESEDAGDSGWEVLG